MPKHVTNTRVQAAITALRQRVARGSIPKAECEWGGANVVISAVSRGRRYREVITPYALQVSWLFTELRDEFANMIDSCSKFEFYGRLEVTANRAIRGQPTIEAVALCDALLDEVDDMFVEITTGRFQVLPVAIGAGIAHDYKDERP